MTAEQGIRIPMEVRAESTWLTWIGSTAGCLQALGTECDSGDVAGYSGYAFLMNVRQDLCPSGPTAFDWQVLETGLRSLGRTTLIFRGAHCPCEAEQGGDADSIRREMRGAYEVVAGEVAAGRPCVLWGINIPEFNIAVGVRDGEYLIAGEGESIPFDRLTAPGGAYVLAFPTPADVSQTLADRNAVYHALQVLDMSPTFPGYATGQAAYDTWIAALEANRADTFGNSYNAGCWADAKCFARDFLNRLAGRNEAVAEPLGRAAAAYTEVAEAMSRVASLFPFPDSEERVSDPEVRAEAIQALRIAKAAEARAAEALSQAAASWPVEED